MAKKKYIANFTMRVDGKKYKPGETVEIEESHGEELLARGTVKKGKNDPVVTSSGMPEPNVGEPAKNENAAKIITATPGSPEANK